MEYKEMLSVFVSHCANGNNLDENTFLIENIRPFLCVSFNFMTIRSLKWSTCYSSQWAKSIILKGTQKIAFEEILNIVFFSFTNVFRFRTLWWYFQHGAETGPRASCKVQSDP